MIIPSNIFPIDDIEYELFIVNNAGPAYSLCLNVSKFKV